MEKKKSGRKVGDGEGVPRRVLQKPVKVFPSENTNFVGLYRERCADTHTYTHTHKIQHIMLKIHISGQHYNFDLTHSLIV